MVKLVSELEALHAKKMLEELRRSIAQLAGEDPDTWPSHGNAALAMAASYALMRNDLAAAKQENEKLRAALRFYANPAVYAPHPHGPGFDRRDISYRAKNTLAEVGDDELPPNFAACCNSTDLVACDCVNKQHIRVLFGKGGRKYQPTGGSL